MALHGNYTLLQKSPAFFIGGPPGDNVSNWCKTGRLRGVGLIVGRTAGDAAGWSGASLPHGQVPPGSWRLAQVDGWRHARANTSISSTATGALGRNMTGSSLVELVSTALGGLIAGGVGNATITLTPSGSIVATIGAPGSATISLGAVANTGALGWLIGDAPLDITGALVAYARGHMVGTTEEQGLSVAGIVNAMMATLIETGLTFREATRIIAAATAGKVSGAGTTTVTIRSAVADDVDRIVATVDGDGNRSAITYDLG
jgi:hypothetical protein